ncbi:MAG: LamG domain-containing protein, partial [Actinobacteria bacterium]|nr:LamG domain-containing protein [Actinomycetota bacterium]
WPRGFTWTVGNHPSLQALPGGLDGEIDQVAVYDRVMSADEIASHYTAGATGFSGEKSGVRVGRVLDVVGVPSALRDIATGDTTVGPADYGGSSAGDYLARVTESEQGYLYVDHLGGGKLKFRSRYERFTATRSTTSQATYAGSEAGVA